MKSLLLAVASILLAGCMPSPQSGAVGQAAPVAWTQYGLSDTPDLIARALVGRGDSCPAVEWDGQVSQMAVRDPLRVEAFGKLCESRRAFGQAVKVRVRQGGAMLLDQNVTRRPERIAVMGDTGCRITFYFDQKCNDPASWPFATVAASALAQQPDLILHLGDYYYREAPCLASDTKCAPGPYGDREPSWRFEFFEPARGLLAKAPWVFGRGNHEDCQRGGFGWAYYFGDGAPACDITHTTSFVRLNGLTVVNFDTAATGNRFLVKDMNKNWADLAAKLTAESPAVPGEPILLMTHEPGYFICTDKQNRLEPCKESLTRPIDGVRTIADASRRSGRRTILLSGHIHTFRALDVAPPSLGGQQSITQVAVGNGGANQNEDPTPPEMVPPLSVDTRFYDAGHKAGVPIRVQGWTEFGFGMLSASSLQLTMFDKQGRPQFACGLADEKTAAPRCR